MAARVQELPEPVDDLARIDNALLAMLLGPGDLLPNQRSLSIGQIARVAKHTAVVPDVILVGLHRKLPRVGHFRQLIT